MKRELHCTRQKATELKLLMCERETYDIVYTKVASYNGIRDFSPSLPSTTNCGE